MRLARIVLLRARLSRTFALALVSLVIAAPAASHADAPAQGRTADDSSWPPYWKDAPAPAPAPKPTTPPEPPNAPPEKYVPGPPRPEGARDLSSTLVGLGSHYFGTPANRDQGPAFDVLFGVMYGHTRNMLAFSFLDGPHPECELGLRYDVTTQPRPFSFGAGLELGLIIRPVVSEVTHRLATPLLTGDLLVNVFNVGYRWKQLLLVIRVASLGVYLEQPTPLTARFAIESGLEVSWLPDAK